MSLKIAVVVLTAATAVATPAVAKCVRGSPCWQKCQAQHQVTMQACVTYWGHVNDLGRSYARGVEADYWRNKH